MRKAFFTGAVALSLFAFVASSAGTTPSSQSTSLTIRLISIIGPPRFKDRPPTGLSKGDVLSGPSVLHNAVKQFGRAKGAVVGHDYYVQTLSSPTSGILTAFAHLPGGTIHVRGHFHVNTNADTIPVVGGTGRYAGARGSTYVRDLRPGRSLNVYNLRIP